MPIEVWPVIHVDDQEQAIRCAGIAHEAGCVGVFLISMHGNDESLDRIAPRVHQTFPSLKIGVNYLTLRASAALLRSQRLGYAATWTDCQEFIGGRVSREARCLSGILRPGHLFFAAVAFKGQAADDLPGDSAKAAADLGFIPTTSGPGTGVAPDVSKIVGIRECLQNGDPLAVASGLTPENLHHFAPHLSHALVSTGISKSFHEFDAEKLRQFMRGAV
jgi:hypothetical protein